MAGNVWEWTCSINDKKNDAEQKCFDEEGFYGLRGGSWYTNKYSIRSAGFRRFGNKTTELHGFRLVLEN